MFQGEEIRRLDEKSRVIIPPKFRHFVGETDKVGYFLTVVPLMEETCIRLYTPSEWNQIAASLKRLAPRSQNPDSFARVVSSHSEFADLDAQNRILVSQRLIEYAKLEKKSDLVLVGCTNHIQMWNLAAWRRTVEADRQAMKGLETFVRGIFGGYGGPPL